MEVEHDCDSGEDNVYIYKDHEKWWINIHEEAATVIYYCPYCAEKLE